MNLKSFVLFAALAASLSAQVTVQSDRWMPLAGTPNEEPAGYAIELLVATFTPAEAVSYTLQPWQTAISNVIQAKADAIIGVAKDEAPDLLFPNEPVAHIDYGLFARGDSTFVYSEEALKTAKIGVVKGYTYWPALDALIASGTPNITIYGGQNALADAVAALQAGDIDLFPESKPVFAWAVQEQELNPDSFVSKHSHDGGFIYVAFSKTERGTKLAAQWDASIARLRKDGTLSTILARYNVADWTR